MRTKFRGMPVGLLAGLVVLCAICSISAFAQEKKNAAGDSSKAVKELESTWKNAKKWTLSYVDAMPEDAVGFKPTPEIRSFAEQMLHLANANYAFAAAATGIASPSKVNLEKTDSMKTKAACTKAVMDSYDFVISSVKATDPKKLGESVKVFGQDMTRGVALAKAFEHQTHHRGQTTIYIRLKGAKPPQEKLF